MIFCPAQRAIAAFLAELSTSDNKSCIVFDDPISSLDHKHRECVAIRLAKEASTRQVIIFTHNIEFLFYLAEACKKTGATLKYEHLTKRPSDGATGIHHDGAPPKARNIKDRITTLKNRVSKERYHHDQGDEAQWNKSMRSIYDDLRDAWERAVEETVKPVLARFSNKVDTGGLVKLTCIDINDCKTMREAYGRISKWHHSEGVDLNSNLSTPDEIDNEIVTLENWYNAVKIKQENIKNDF